MKLPQHVIDNSLEYILGVIGLLAWWGALGWLDARHIQRVDWINSEITDEQREIRRLELYNEFGSEGNRPAREAIINERKDRVDELQRQMESIDR